MISRIVPGGLDAFKKTTNADNNTWCEKAIEAIKQNWTMGRKIEIFTWDFMFWEEEDGKVEGKEEIPSSVLTGADWRTYTHIIYLDIDPEIIQERRTKDQARRRPITSITRLRRWQEEERLQLRDLCLRNKLLFIKCIESSSALPLVKDFGVHTEVLNSKRAGNRLSAAFGSILADMKTILVLDSDRTPCAEDTGKMFWENINSNRDPLKQTFTSFPQYPYNYFRQVALLYESINKNKFSATCKDVTMRPKIHNEFKKLFGNLRDYKYEHFGAVIVTCGLKDIWEIIRREGLVDVVKVIGNGLISDGFVFTPVVKGELVAQLQNEHNICVVAFGDSPVDLKMLIRANHAIDVVEEESTRSKSMSTELPRVLDNILPHAYQVLLPDTATPILEVDKITLTTLDVDKFLGMILDTHEKEIVVHDVGNKNAAKLLMTAMRDAAISGSMLRKAHHRVGFYLATEYLGDVIGLEWYPITHIQGCSATGHRLKDERKTTIVALMLGGEPLAFVVNDAFPLAMFVHAREPTDLKLCHVQFQKTVILVDSVINNGTTIVKFVEDIVEICPKIRIVAVTGVAQRQSIIKGGILYDLAVHKDFALVTLRISDNKFTGKGTTDTGNRLFNTTGLD